MKRLADLSYEEICTLPPGTITDVLVARECLGLKVAEVRSDVHYLDAKRASSGATLVEYVLHRPNYPGAIADYQRVKPYSMEEEAAVDLVRLYDVWTFFDRARLEENVMAEAFGAMIGNLYGALGE